MKKLCLLLIAALILSGIVLPLTVLAEDQEKTSVEKVAIDKQPEDPKILKELAKHGMLPEYVELDKDYGTRANGKSPYSITYKDRLSNKKITLITSLPHVDYYGNAVNTETTGWYSVNGDYYNSSIDQAHNNLFWAFVRDTEIVLTVENDQPDGRKQGDVLTFAPELYLDGKKQDPASGTPTLLPVDPINSNYTDNTLEWDYSFATRRLRLIEGMIQGSWHFAYAPPGDVLIKYNQAGDYRLKLGQYAINDDEEFIPQAVFDQAEYPLVVSDSSTFNPDANPESTSVDGYVQHNIAENTWATVRDGAGTEANDSVAGAMAWEIRAGATSPKFDRIRRSIFLFDTSALPDAATILSVTLSIFGSGANADPAGWTPAANIYSSAPADNDALVAGDFNSLGTTAFSDTDIGYASWSAAYQDFVFNSTGIAAVDKTGISKFGSRDAKYDVADSPPSHSTSARAYVQCLYSEAGAGNEPKLVVVFLGLPTVTTQAVSNIAVTTATGNGNITDTGGENNDLRGFVWSTSSQGAPGDVAPPGAYSSNSTESGSFSTGAFTGSITGLTGETPYYVRAYSHNSAGWAYGGEATFNTFGPPTMTALDDATSVEETTATLSGNVTAINGANAITRGFFWDTDSGAPYANTWTEDGDFGVGTFTHAITGLTRGELYYYISTGINTYGTGNSTVVTFLTKPDAPNTFAASVNGTTALDLSWVMGTGANNAYIVRKDGSYPTNRADGVVVYNGTATNFTDTGLTGGHTYYYKNWSLAQEGGKEQFSDNFDNAFNGPGRAQKMWLVWQYGSTFTDQAGYGNDGTPTFRTASSNSSVSAELVAYSPASEAKVPTFTLVSAVTILSEVPAAMNQLYTELDFTNVPGASAVNEILAEGDIPQALWWFPVIYISIAIIGLLVYGATRLRGGNGSLLTMCIVCEVLLALVGITNPVPLWPALLFPIPAVALIISAKHHSWG